MDKYDDPSATLDREFSNGDPELGVQRSLMKAEWLNTVQRELVAVVEGAGLVLDGDNDAQILQAVLLLAGSNGFVTGDVKMSYRAAAPQGWLLLAGGTIGSSTSAASLLAAAAAIDLFNFLWDSFDDTLCPVSGGRGASAAADWAADKTITVFDDRNQFYRVKPAAGRPLASLEDDAFQDHDHSIPNQIIGGGSYVIAAGGSTSVTNADTGGPIENAGSGGPVRLADETRPKNRALNAFIKL